VLTFRSAQIARNTPFHRRRFALDALREGFYGEHADRLLLVEYEALAKHPRHGDVDN
jgi:hypothetical protein